LDQHRGRGPGGAAPSQTVSETGLLGPGDMSMPVPVGFCRASTARHACRLADFKAF